MTVRESLSSGKRGAFGQKLLETYDDPCEANFRLLRAVADGPNQLAITESQLSAYLSSRYRLWDDAIRASLREHFPVLLELDREMVASDYSRLPREAQV